MRPEPGTDCFFLTHFVTLGESRLLCGKPGQTLGPAPPPAARPATEMPRGTVFPVWSVAHPSGSHAGASPEGAQTGHAHTTVLLGTCSCQWVKTHPGLPCWDPGLRTIVRTDSWFLSDPHLPQPRAPPLLVHHDACPREVAPAGNQGSQPLPPSILTPKGRPPPAVRTGAPLSTGRTPPGSARCAQEGPSPLEEPPAGLSLFVYLRRREALAGRPGAGGQGEDLQLSFIALRKTHLGYEVCPLEISLDILQRKKERF